jgi:choline-sulfatase
MRSTLKVRACRVGPLLIVAALLLPEVSSLKGVDAPPRNLLVITLDTMRADRLSAYGFSGLHTPAFDRLARGGVVFEQAFAHAPLTLPSHTSLFTGILPPGTGVRDNVSPPLKDEFTTLAEVLRSRGLKTAAFVGSSVLAPNRGLAQGFESYAEAVPNCSGAAPRRRASEVVDDALGWLRSLDRSPFFAWVHLFDTHRPYDLPDEFKNRHFDPYLAAIAFEDAQVGRLLAYLETQNLLNNTLIVVAGDHGESLGDHGEESHGIFLYEEALRVPLIIHGGRLVPRRSMSVARLVDVMPTVLDLFDIPSSKSDGASLADIEAEPAASPREVYAEAVYPLRFGWAPLRSLRADRFKFIDAPRPELYNLAADPTEQRNVVAEYPKVAAVMRSRIGSIDHGLAAPRTALLEVDRTTLQRIGSLGYVSGTHRKPATGHADLPDPKDRIGIFNELTARQVQNAQLRRSWCR